MDKDIRELIVTLCTRAGMIMEDASLLAVTMLGTAPEATSAALTRLQADAATISALLEAATLLTARDA
ncbi:hypothetical protein [Sphingomonas nostoxanthinifaciens]|uniref:hypothetical protein n=1 Tax=Sphingomonas nostoxanthinifaciens TaxID=2872652 RepID=UPI001CC21126|nr:hypothetical protein [Sphingomonas nostoxanthinifaciens]UAK25272.1 hypothetical protein K8P63_03510 [Sphingomonas nostoxanthinifaciens]